MLAKEENMDTQDVVENTLVSENETRDRSHIQVLSRAAAVLRALRDSGGLSQANLAEEVGLARSTVHRIVTTLERERFVTTDTADGRIQLGIGLVSLGMAVNVDLRRELHPYLESLSMELDETVDLSVMDRNRLLFLDQISRLRRLRAVSGVGIAFPMHCTANGKALLASLSNDRVMELVPESLETFTPNTLATREELLHQLDRIRSAGGIAFDREEHTLGICALGSVVHGPLNQLAVISIPIPSVRFYGRETMLADALRRMVDQINQRYQPASL